MVYANYTVMAERLLVALKGCLGIACGVVALSVVVSIIRERLYKKLLKL